MILFFTTFDKKLFKVSAKMAIRSFRECVPWGQMLVCHEGNMKLPNSKQLIYDDISNDSFLQEWLEVNKDIIPKELGGETDIDDEIFTQSKQHFFRRRAASWFRKIVALKKALEYAKLKNEDYIISLDCDVVFLRELSQDFIVDLLSKSSITGFMGKSRKEKDKGLECGFVGFNLKEDGERFINLIVELFTSKNFRSYLRWDDSYLYSKIIEEYKFSFNDLTPPKVYHSRVMNYGKLSSFIRHNKGIHQKSISSLPRV